MAKYSYGKRLDPKQSKLIINKLGGASAVAKLFSITPGAVFQWGLSGMPDYRYQLLLCWFPDILLPVAREQAKN